MVVFIKNNLKKMENIENLNLKPIDLEETRKQIFKPLHQSAFTWKKKTSLARVGLRVRANGKDLLELIKTIL